MFQFVLCNLSTQTRIEKCIVPDSELIMHLLHLIVQSRMLIQFWQLVSGLYNYMHTT